MHGLVGSAHLNGTIGTGITRGDFGSHDADSRLGVKPIGDGGPGIQVRRRHLHPSRLYGEQPLIAQPCPSDDGTFVWALTSAHGQMKGSTSMEKLHNGIALCRLGIVPEPQPDEVADAVALA